MREYFQPISEKKYEMVEMFTNEAKPADNGLQCGLIKIDEMENFLIREISKWQIISKTLNNYIAAFDKVGSNYSFYQQKAVLFLFLQSLLILVQLLK